MERERHTLENIGIRYGLYSTVGLVAYFMLMKIIGLVHIVELRMLNFIILVAGIVGALRRFKSYHAATMTYLQGYAIGILTSAVAVVPFALFIFIYLQLDAVLLEYIKAGDSFGQHLNPYMLSFIIAFEGLFSGLILTFIIMQYAKRGRLQGGGVG